MKTLALILGGLTVGAPAGSAQAAKKASTMMRWGNLVIAIRPSDSYGVTVYLGPSLDALRGDQGVQLRDASFRPDALDDWLPFAQFFLEEKGPVFGPGGTRASPVLTSEGHRLLAFSQDAAPPANEPDFLLFFSDSGGANRLVARATRDHLREFLAALRTASRSAKWAPDTTKTSSAGNCRDEGDGLKPVTIVPGNRLNAPYGVTGQGFVIANYVVDARGRADPSSLDIIYSDHKVLSDQIRRDMKGWRFQPAECRGVPVRQLVSQVFTFRLNTPEQE